jgi:hypothetical protein
MLALLHQEFREISRARLHSYERRGIGNLAEDLLILRI